jgi:hypothetical protein
MNVCFEFKKIEKMPSEKRLKILAHLLLMLDLLLLAGLLYVIKIIVLYFRTPNG